MESLHKVRSQNIVTYLNKRIMTKASSNLMEQFWFSDWTHFATVCLYKGSRKRLKDEISKLPLLTSDEAMCLLERLAPTLQSLHVNPVHFNNTRGFQFGSYYVRIPDFNFLHLFDIICAKSFNLERISVDLRKYCYKCYQYNRYYVTDVDIPAAMEEIIKNNSNLKAIGLGPDIRLLEILTPGMKIPSLTEISIRGLYVRAILNKFSLLAEHLTVLDMSECPIETFSDLPELILEISRHKETLECLRLNLDYVKNYSKYHVLADLKMCYSLKELRIEVCDAQKLVPCNFLADILKACSNLDVLCLKNFSFDNETVELLEASRPLFRNLVITNDVDDDENDGGDVYDDDDEDGW